MSKVLLNKEFKAFLKPLLGPRVIRWLWRLYESFQVISRRVKGLPTALESAMKKRLGTAGRARAAFALRMINTIPSPDIPMLWLQLARVPGRKYRGLLSRHVVMLVVSDIRVDPRVQKAVKVAVGLGFSVTVVTPHRDWSDDASEFDWGAGVSFAFPEAGAYFINHDFPWLVNTRFFDFCCRYRNVIFHCHDLNTALMGLHLARKTDSVCIADFHEWFSENVTWSTVESAYVAHTPLKRKVMRRAERLCIMHADHGITVCDSIANELAGMVPGSRRFTIVRNIPDLALDIRDSRPPLKVLLGLPESTFVVLWQGGIGPSRLLEPVIEALPLVDGVHLVIRGPGLEKDAHYTRYYTDYAAKLGVGERVTLLPPVPSRDVLAAAQGADVGLWTLPNLSKNFYYALPNKLFEYLGAELPVLVANFPEAAALVRRYNVGLTFDPYSPASIAESMRTMRGNPVLRKQMQVNTRTALQDMDAASEWIRLGHIYQDLMDRSLA